MVRQGRFVGFRATLLDHWIANDNDSASITIGRKCWREFGTAGTLPPSIYHDLGIHSLELERIFCRDIAASPIIVVRQKYGSVKALANVCVHRAARLLECDDHVTRISCPYHSWTYAIDGQFIGAPFMQDTPDFDTATYRLKELACNTWEGFIYVASMQMRSHLCHVLRL